MSFSICKNFEFSELIPTTISLQFAGDESNRMLSFKFDNRWRDKPLATVFTVASKHGHRRANPWLLSSPSHKLSSREQTPGHCFHRCERFSGHRRRSTSRMVVLPSFVSTWARAVSFIHNRNCFHRFKLFLRTLKVFQIRGQY